MRIHFVRSGLYGANRKLQLLKLQQRQHWDWDQMGPSESPQNPSLYR